MFRGELQVVSPYLNGDGAFHVLDSVKELGYIIFYGLWIWSSILCLGGLFSVGFCQEFKYLYDVAL